MISNLDLVFLTCESRINEQALLGMIPKSKILFWEAGPKGKIYFSKFGFPVLFLHSKISSGVSQEVNNKLVEWIDNKTIPWKKNHFF